MMIGDKQRRMGQRKFGTDEQEGRKKTMINNNERREIARRIKKFISISRDKQPWDNDGLQTVGRLIGTSFGENILLRLASLIDRPTCKNLSTKPADELFCGACGEHVEIVYMESTNDYHAQYCPTCGTEICDGD